MTVINKYLDCGDLHMGFVRTRCEECGYAYLLGRAGYVTEDLVDKYLI